AMERQYQRTRIQEESLKYESLKHTGELPIVGVNTFLDPEGSPTVLPREVIRSTEDEKEFAISSLSAFQQRNEGTAREALANLRRSALEDRNTFDALMEAAKVCSLGQMTNALYEVGGQYRRNM
ncbi:MAG: methylmalonyl-CoA mutase, partial [Gemmatimonadetes bacterium]|nr:methylmalonyl-CoA mutase [Gemmatimonadota bacterium]